MPDPTAQDVIDALRFVKMAQSDDAEIIKMLDVLLDLAPETDSDRGIQLVLELLTEGSLKVALYEPNP